MIMVYRPVSELRTVLTYFNVMRLCLIPHPKSHDQEEEENILATLKIWVIKQRIGNFQNFNWNVVLQF